MTGGEIVRQTLTGSPYATDAGEAVRSDAADEKDDYPFIVFRRTNVFRDWGLDNTLMGTRETFQIECWDETPAKAQVLEQQVVEAFLTIGVPTLPNDPDAQDPTVLVNCAVVNVDIWT